MMSVTMARAPRCTASSMNWLPWTFWPGRAKKISPGSMRRLSELRPKTVPNPFLGRAPEPSSSCETL